MISLEQFGNEFTERHEFDYEDSDFLVSKYAHISFENIPEAWVCLIDMFVSRLKQQQKVISISQVMGQLVVNYQGTSEFDKKSLQKLDCKLSQLDVDLVNELEAGIILN